MRWQDFRSDAASMGEEVEDLLAGPGVVLLGTVRADGSARISACEPFFWDGELWLPMMWGSRKAADLHRDPRITVHSIIASRDGANGEAKVRGVAVIERDDDRVAEVCKAISAALPWDPEPARVEMFRVDVEHVCSIRYSERGDQSVSLWPAHRSFVRRATSATSVGGSEDETSF